VYWTTLNGKAFIYLGGEKLKQHKAYEKVLCVEKSAVKERMPAGKSQPFQ